MAQAEKRTNLLRDIITNLKEDKLIWEPVAKAAQRYADSLKLMQKSAVALAQALNDVAEHAANAKSGTSDLGVGIHQMAETIRNLETKRDATIKSLTDDVAAPLQANFETNKRTAGNMEKDFLKEFKRLKDEIDKAQSASQKAGKKSPEDLKKAITLVNDKVKEMETMGQTKLREAIVEERKRYCFFIMHFSNVIKADVELFNQGTSAYNKNLPNWIQLAVSPEQLPPAVEQLVEIQQRTFVPIQGDGGTSYYDDQGWGAGVERMSVFDPVAARNVVSGGTTISPQPAAAPAAPSSSMGATDNVIRPGDKVKGLYDYVATEADKLSFREGDIISVQEADASGWCLGQVEGRVGWFPGNYVEKIKPTAAPAPPAFTAPAAPPSYGAPAGAPQPMAMPGMGMGAATLKKTPVSAPAPAAAPKAASSAPAPPPKKGGGGGGGGGGAPPPPPNLGGGGGGPPPPPPNLGGGGGGDRGGLLSQIQKGTGLRKTVTNDRSAPKV